MNHYLITKCPNCDASMEVLEDRIECPCCGTRYVSLYLGGTSVDVATIELDKLSSAIKDTRRNFIIVGGKIKSNKIEDVIDETKLKIANDALQKEDYATALKFSDGKEIESVRIHFLARRCCKNESKLQGVIIWDGLRSYDIPDELCNHERYGQFYSSLREYCKNRESAQTSSYSIAEEYYNKYFYLAPEIKRISGQVIFEILKSKAEQNCKKYPMFPEPWLVLSFFDNNAIKRLFAAFKNDYYPFADLHYYMVYKEAVIKPIEQNHITTYSIPLKESDLSLIDSEIMRRYNSQWTSLHSSNIPYSFAAHLSAQLPIPDALILKNNTQKKSETIAEKVYNVLILLQSTCISLNNSGGRSIWTHALASPSKGERDQFWYRNAYWVSTSNTKSPDRSRYPFNDTNYGLSFCYMISDNDKNSFVSQLKNGIEKVLGFTNYNITMENFYYEFRPDALVFKDRRIVGRLFKIDLSW